MTEYWLQKKTIGGWSQVTNYRDLDQAKRNFVSCVGKGDSGYCWRLAEVKELEVSMLDEIVEISYIPPDISITKDMVDIHEAMRDPQKSGWGDNNRVIVKGPGILNPDAPKSSGWGQTAPWGQNQMSNSPTQTEGLSKLDGRGAKSGSVCLMHHGLKKRCRAMPEELDMLLKDGWVRGGPRTQFEG